MQVLKPIKIGNRFAVALAVLLALMFLGYGSGILTCSPGFADDMAARNGIVPLSSGQLRIKYTVSRFDETQGKYVDIQQETEIDPGKSALVIVDLWKETYLDSMTVNFINPLIEDLHRLGVHIIYAPSQREQNDNLLIIDQGVTFYVHDIMDQYLFDNEIENLFYVGFDAFYCVMDKPNGIYSYRSRDYDRSSSIFVFDEGLLSYTKEMKETAIALMKKNNIGVLVSDSATYHHQFPRKTVMDVFARTVDHVDSGANFIVIFNNGQPAEALSEFEQQLIVNNLNFAVVSNGKMSHRDETIEGFGQFITLLKHLKIRNIYYCGYFLNNEILWGEFGITPLYIKKRYHIIKDLPETYIITDLSYIVPSASIDPGIEKATVINHYRNLKSILSSTLLDELTADSDATQSAKDTLQK